MTKKEFKAIRRAYRIAFKTGSYPEFWDKVPSKQFDLYDRIAKTYHDKDHTFSNKLDHFRIWGL